MKLKEKLAINYIRARLNILSLVSSQKAARKAFDLFCTPFKKPGKKTPAIFEKGEKLSFRLDGHTIRGHRWLPRTSGAPLKRVLIVHGFASSSINFDQYVSALLKKEYEVLAFDAPAHGQSGGKRITLPMYVSAIHSIYEWYGPIHAFMGHSLGATALSLFLESTPHDETTKVVLIAPFCEMVAAVDGFFQLLQLNTQVRTAFDEIGHEAGGRPFSWYSMRRIMHSIRADILWIQDEDDQITPVADTLLIKKDGHPNIHFILTQGLGHRKIYRDGETLKQVAAFL